MSKILSITISDALHRALQIKGAPLELDAGPYLKQFVTACAIGYDGPLLLRDALNQAVNESVTAADHATPLTPMLPLIDV